MVMEPPHAQIRAKNIFALPLDWLGRYSIKSVIPWGMQDIKIPTKNRKSNNHKNDGESEDAIPNTKSKAEEVSSALRRPKWSVIKPHIGEAIDMARNTTVVREATLVVLTFHDEQVKIGPINDSIIISIASDKFATPINIVKIIWNFPYPMESITKDGFGDVTKLFAFSGKEISL